MNLGRLSHIDCDTVQSGSLQRCETLLDDSAHGAVLMAVRLSMERRYQFACLGLFTISLHI